MFTISNGIGRRTVFRLMAASALCMSAFAGSAQAEPVELRYFYRAPWPSCEIYANWLIDQWNAKNGDRIRVTGASVDGKPDAHKHREWRGAERLITPYYQASLC